MAISHIRVMRGEANLFMSDRQLRRVGSILRRESILISTRDATSFRWGERENLYIQRVYDRGCPMPGWLATAPRRFEGSRRFPSQHKKERRPFGGDCPCRSAVFAYSDGRPNSAKRAIHNGRKLNTIPVCEGDAKGDHLLTRAKKGKNDGEKAAALERPGGRVKD